MHGFFGGSSAGNFVTQIHEAATQRLSSSGHLGPTTNKTGPCPRPPRPWGQRLQWPRISLDACALPPRSRADALMDVYWNAVHPLYPFVDRAVFSSQYDGLFATNAPPDIDSSLTCALNIIFALSCQLDTTSSAGSRHQSARIFFQRAQESLDLWRLPPSLESVQVLLLLGQYLQSTNEPFQCWTFVGSAIRMAENLGLHLKATTENVTSVRHREILRRVWHGCILMDRVLAMTYGRPTMINRAVAADTPLPITVDEEDLSDDSRLPPQIADRPSRLDFFVQSLRLYDILDDILVTLYESREKQEHQSKGAGFFKLHQSSIIDIDSQLMDWEESLPEQLRNVPLSHKGQKPPMLPQPTVFFRQAVVLRQR